MRDLLSLIDKEKGKIVMTSSILLNLFRHVYHEF